MIVVVPSMGRAGSQVTLRHLRPLRLEPRPVIVVPAAEAARYVRSCEGADVTSPPDSVRGIAATREWILGPYAMSRDARHLLMLDDDMDFCWRPDVRSAKLVTLTGVPDRLRQMLALLEGWLRDGFAHVGV